MDQGILAVLKRAFKRELLLLLVETFDEWESLQEKAASMPRGCAGVAQGSPPNMLDVCELLAEIWENFRPSTIARCWVAAGILNAEQDRALDEASSSEKLPRGKGVRIQSKDADVDEITGMLAALAVPKRQGDEDFLDFQELDQSQVKAAVEEWIDMEQDPEVALIELENEADEEDSEDEDNSEKEGPSNAVQVDETDEDDNDDYDKVINPVKADSLLDVLPAMYTLDQMFNDFRTQFPETTWMIDQVKVVL